MPLASRRPAQRAGVNTGTDAHHVAALTDTGTSTATVTTNAATYATRTEPEPEGPRNRAERRAARFGGPGRSAHTWREARRTR